MHQKLNVLRKAGFFINISCFSLSHIKYINEKFYADKPQYNTKTPFTIEVIIRNERAGTQYEEDSLGRSTFEAEGKSLEEAVDLVYEKVQKANK